MAIIVRLDRIMADRKVVQKDLVKELGITPDNLSKLKTGKVSSVKLETMDKICKALKCQPGDLFEYVDEEE